MPLVGIPSMMVANTINANPVFVFDPSSLTGLKIWLKADAQSYTDGQSVTTWTDSSGNANDFVTDSTNPTFKTNIVNGKPVVRFNGTSGGDDLKNTTALSLLNNVGSATIFAVCSDTNSGGGTAIHPVVHISTGTTITNPRASIFTKNTSAQFISTGRRLDADTGVQATSTFSSGFHTLVNDSDWTNNALQIYVDGVAGTSGTYSSGGGSTSATNSLGIELGSLTTSFNFPGDIAEVLVYVPKLSSTDRQSVEGYLRTKYATP